MPIITRFYGIVVKMYLIGKEHNPPHVHFLYGDHNCVIDLLSGTITEGDMPPRAAAMATEWTNTYRSELLDMWNTQNFKQLPPLK